jgi:tetratricopeptide (TPR) repeat protein
LLDQWGIMSYINDALHKVQKEKESLYASSGIFVSSEAKKPDARKKWLPFAILIIIFFFVVGIVALLYWLDVRKTPRTVSIVQSPGIATTQPMQSMPPASVPKTPALVPTAQPEIAVPFPAEVEETPATDNVPAEVKEKKQNAAIPAKVKGKKQNAVIPAGRMKQKASPKPELADSKMLYAQALQKQNEGKLEEAKALYERVIKADPRHVSALNNLGVIFMNRKMYQQAVISYKKALNIRYNYVDAHYNLACLYAQKNDTELSLFYLKNAINFNPEVRQWAARDDDLKNLTDLPEFKKIMQARNN